MVVVVGGGVVMRGEGTLGRLYACRRCILIVGTQDSMPQGARRGPTYHAYVPCALGSTAWLWAVLGVAAGPVACELWLYLPLRHSQCTWRHGSLCLASA